MAGLQQEYRVLLYFQSSNSGQNRVCQNDSPLELFQKMPAKKKKKKKSSGKAKDL